MKVNSTDTRFAFGDNWSQFAKKYLSNTRIELAKRSLIDFYDIVDFSGLKFLDIGCGSGLFSLAAVELGAEVHSFDYDPEAVTTAHRIKRERAPDASWTIEQGDILNEDYVTTLGKSDLVYSWGVLHHTGAMYEAIENTVSLVKEGGQVYLALYQTNNDDRITTDQWKTIKKWYVSGGAARKRLLLALYIGLWTARRFRNGENPLKTGQNYGDGDRGMALLPDMRDWLGGYPYEHATIEEVKTHVEAVSDLKLKRVEPSTGNGCSEYLFY